MKIGIDITVAKINQAGTGVYISSLVHALQNCSSQHEYYLFAAHQYREMAKPKTIRSRLETIYRDVVWMHIVLPWHVRRSGIDVLHMPANVAPLSVPCPTVVTILDTTILQMPEHFTAWHRNYSRRFIPVSAKNASSILTISQQSKHDIIKQLAVHCDKVIVTYLAASPRFHPISEPDVVELKQKYNLDSFVLTVGTLEPRKNMIRLLRAFDLARQRGYAGQLIHVGPQGWLFDDILREVHRLGLQKTVRFLGRVPLDDLVKLYNAASVFAYPSLYEGFGLPVLEAMACGCPVITSNISSLPEVAGKAAIMVDPHQVSQIADAMLHVLEDRALAQSLRQQGIERAKLFTWERCARETLAAYERCMRRI